MRPLSDRLVIGELLAIPDTISDFSTLPRFALVAFGNRNTTVSIIIIYGLIRYLLLAYRQQVWQVPSRHSQFGRLKHTEIGTNGTLLFPTYHTIPYHTVPYLIACDNYKLYISPSAVHTHGSLRWVCGSFRGNSYKYHIDGLQLCLGMQILR